MPKTKNSTLPKVTGAVDLPAKSRSLIKRKKDKPPATDPATWPESTIEANERITAGDIDRYYHLAPSVYSALSRSSYKTGKGFTAHLYNEREVERAAWTKYGSPEGYEAHLEDLRQRQAVRNPQKPFLTPSLRKKSRNSFDAIDITSNGWETGPTGLWKLDPLPSILQDIKDRFPTGSEWLWESCNEKLDPVDPTSMDMKLAERARVLRLVLDNPSQGGLAPYPPRPPPGSLVSPSESVDKLRMTLAQAPRIPKDGNGMDEIVGMVRYETWHPEWDIWYDWDKNYYNEVFQALIGVVEQHGVGDEGWASARWEVYDTYAECVSGIQYDNWKGERWIDSARRWLDASSSTDHKLGQELKAIVDGREIESGGAPV